MENSLENTVKQMVETTEIMLHFFARLDLFDCETGKGISVTMSFTNYICKMFDAGLHDFSDYYELLLNGQNHLLA